MRKDSRVAFANATFGDPIGTRIEEPGLRLVAFSFVFREELSGKTRHDGDEGQATGRQRQIEKRVEVGNLARRVAVHRFQKGNGPG